MKFFIPGKPEMNKKVLCLCFFGVKKKKYLVYLLYNPK